MEAQDGFPYRTPIMTRQGRWGAKVTTGQPQGSVYLSLCLCDMVVDALLTV